MIVDKETKRKRFHNTSQTILRGMRFKRMTESIVIMVAMEMTSTKDQEQAIFSILFSFSSARQLGNSGKKKIGSVFYGIN